MMKKNMALAVLLFAGNSAVTANEKAGHFQFDSLEMDSDQNRLASEADTIVYSDLISARRVSEPQSIYKLRLDSIAGEVPLPHNEHVQNYIELYVSRRKEQVAKMLGLSKYYFPIFERSFREAGVPDEIKFITVVESALNPHAVSRVGAVGPWQFMYTTAKGYGLVMDHYVDERKDPAKSSYAAALYLKEAYKHLGDWLLAIAAYNCGTGAVKRAIARAGGETDFWKLRSFLPRETQNYVPAFIATVYAMNYYSKHGIEPGDPGFNTSTDIIDVNRTVSLSNIAKAADINVNHLQFLNPSYKKQIVNGSPSSPKRIVIPAVGKELYASLYDVLNPEVANDPQIIAVRNTDSPADAITIPASHKVKEGQTLLMVANQYGLEVQDLKVYNNLKGIDVLPGQEIRLKGEPVLTKAKKSTPAYVTYIVKAGDTLSEIAAKFSGATTSKIKAWNGLKKNVVQPGMKLKINKG